MTTIPPPRAGVVESSGEAGPLLSYIAQTVERIDGKVDALGDTVRREYVPRVELDPRLTRLERAVDELGDQREADDRARQAREREQTRERRNLRIAIAGVGIAGASATTGVVALVLPHLS